MTEHHEQETNESNGFKISDNSWISVGMLSVFIACTVWLVGTLKDLQGSVDKIDIHLKVIDSQIESTVTKKDLKLWGYKLRDLNPEIKNIPELD